MPTIGIMVGDIPDVKAIKTIADLHKLNVVGFGPNDDIDENWLLFAWPDYLPPPSRLICWAGETHVIQTPLVTAHPRNKLTTVLMRLIETHRFIGGR